MGLPRCDYRDVRRPRLQKSIVYDIEWTNRIIEGRQTIMHLSDIA